MKTTKELISALLCAVLLVALASLLPAADQTVPPLINYQGKLVNSNNIPLPTGDYELRFSIWDAATGGTQVWGPQIFNGSTGSGLGPKVPVVQGWFNVMLGPVDTNGAAIASAFTATNRYVQVQVGLNLPLSPRQQILSAPYALMAGSLAPGVAAANLAASGGLILSTADNNPALLGAGYQRLRSTLPVNDAWFQGSINPALIGRYYHMAVWTGTEMLVWGGHNGAAYLNDGGRYNPAANTWTAITLNGAPCVRNLPTVVWTGSEMIVWGGYAGAPLNDGGRYNPAANTWTAIPLTSAPAARTYHTAVWTGSEMIVWGGQDGVKDFNEGGRYNPVANLWTAVNTNGAPTARRCPTAVWTGTEMIVWGGYNGVYLGDGGRYNPAANTWTAITLTGAPAARMYHTAVWTGSEMIVWGGHNGVKDFNEGGRYNPVANLWTAVNTNGAPVARRSHTAVWPGSEMIVWGGYNGVYLGDGGRYNPAANTWTAITLTGAPAARTYHTAVWTGSDMIVFGGTSGSGYYNDTWSYTPSKALFLYQKP